MYIWPILAFIFAALEAVAVSKKLQKLEYVAKPAVMVCLFLWLYLSTGLRGDPLWFGMGILLSLAGDVFLMISLDRLFLFGLLAFLLAHIAYITGFRQEIAMTGVWPLLWLVIIAVNVGRLIKRIVVEIRRKGQNRLVLPVMIYGTVISVMLFAALSTFYDSIWTTGAALLASLGALLFCLSDVILAWNKFVSPIKNGRVLNIALYHLGQIGLIAGVIVQFA